MDTQSLIWERFMAERHTERRVANVNKRKDLPNEFEGRESPVFESRSLLLLPSLDTSCWKTHLPNQRLDSNDYTDCSLIDFTITGIPFLMPLFPPLIVIHFHFHSFLTMKGKRESCVCSWEWEWEKRKPLIRIPEQKQRPRSSSSSLGTTRCCCRHN